MLTCRKPKPSFVVPSRPLARPFRSTRIQRTIKANVFVDSSTLSFESDEQSDSVSESDFDDRRPTKKARLQRPRIKLEQDDEVDRMSFSEASFSDSDSEPENSGSGSPQGEEELMPWDLLSYPETYHAVEKFRHILGPPPPDTDDLDIAKVELANKLSCIPVIDPSKDKKIVILKLPPGTIDKNADYDSTRVGFMDFPGELRNQIYMLAFKSKQQIDFRKREGFCHSAALLRANRTIYNEARNILYGENRFVFDQSTARVGEYFNSEWTEVNYAHIRKFLTDIGPENTSFINNVGLCLEDATPSGHPHKDINERRFENNKDLYWILKHLGRHGRIEKLKLGFTGRRVFHMHKSEAAFLYALAGVKTDELSFGHPTAEGDDSCRWHRLHYGKLSSTLEAMLKGVMVRPVPLKKMHPQLKF